jgi:hypothetical protein
MVGVPGMFLVSLMAGLTIMNAGRVVYRGVYLLVCNLVHMHVMLASVVLSLL